MYDTAPDITSLISARICHDLASPLGAIANGLELLELSGLADTPEAALLGDSIASATARVEFFRIAYGTAKPDALLSPGIAQRRLSDVFSERKINARWDVLTDLPRDTAKLLFLLLQCAETALPFGGDITVSPAGDGWVIRSQGREVRMAHDLWAFVTGAGNGTDLQSSQVQFALAGAEARRLGREISVEANETALTLMVR